MERPDQDAVELGVASEETRGVIPGASELGGKDLTLAGMTDDD